MTASAVYVVAFVVRGISGSKGGETGCDYRKPRGENYCCCRLYLHRANSYNIANYLPYLENNLYNYL